MEIITRELFRLRDEKYKLFQSKLIPTVDADTVIGVRTPDLRRMAKQLKSDGSDGIFLHELPHKYFEENQLHAFIISFMRDFDMAVESTNAFLPYVDNWATCDQLIPKSFAKRPDELYANILSWVQSDKTYTVRFGLGMLMRHFSDDRFDASYLKLAAAVKSDEYYVNMMIAWYFATLLAKQYDATIVYLENKSLDKWIHNKTIQKAVESYRITDDKKAYLKTLRI